MADASTGSALAVPRRLTVDFIDPLFAVVFHIGMLKTVIDNVLYTRLWTALAAHEITLRAVSLWVLGFLNIVLSWHGYHRSIEHRPIRGGLRFYVDILCLGVYLFIILEFENIVTVAWLLVVQYGVYWIWDVAKGFEYARDPKVPRKGGVTLVWGGVFLVIAALLSVTKTFVVEEWQPTFDVLWIVLLFVATVGYRFHKGSAYTGTASQWVVRSVKKLLFGEEQPVDA